MNYPITLLIGIGATVKDERRHLRHYNVKGGVPKSDKFYRPSEKKRKLPSWDPPGGEGPPHKTIAGETELLVRWQPHQVKEGPNQKKFALRQCHSTGPGKTMQDFSHFVNAFGRSSGALGWPCRRSRYGTWN
jgi:hypothetical protein